MHQCLVFQNGCSLWASFADGLQDDYYPVEEKNNNVERNYPEGNGSLVDGE